MQPSGRYIRIFHPLCSAVSNIGLSIHIACQPYQILFKLETLHTATAD